MKKKEKKPGFAKRSNYILIRLTEEEKKKLKELAYSNNLDISEYVRMKVFSKTDRE
jgi:hypothetical protein